MRLIISLLCTLALTACVATTGAVYDDNAAAVAFGEQGSKTGSAKCVRLFGYKSGDCSIGGAMADGRITELRTVSYDSFNIFIYKSNTTTVTGE